HKKYLFDDNTYISSWAKSAVDYSYYMGIIKGTDEYTITPLSNVTVEEAIVLANRILLLKDEFSVKTKPSDKMEWVIKPKFDGMMKQTRFAGGVAVVKKDGCFGYIDQEGKSVTKFVYDDAFDFSEGRGRVEKDGKFGFVDKSGKLCIPIEYDSASDFSYGVVSVEKDGKFGFIDVDGNEVIPFEYESAGNFTEGVAPVMKNLKWGYIDLNNNEVIPFNFDWAGSFVEGYARVEKDTKYGFIKRDGTVSVECIYDYVYDYSCGRAGVYNKEYHGVIDENGKIIVPIGKYSKMGNYSENLLRVRTGGMWLGGYGFIDKAGEPSIRHLFKDAGDYSEGLVWYRIPTDSGDTHGYMNKNGDFILPSCEAERLYTESDSEIFSVNDFSEGLAAVTTSDGLMGFIKNPILK
ncbi:MAG: WG repeat-containing protein, partial [Oscillospiraceae bacterium]